MWHRSEGAALKKSSMPGPKGKRVVHILDPVGKGFFAGMVSRRAPAPPTMMDHGFLANRRKEGAMVVQMSAAWRAANMGYSFILNNHDMTNAFASTKWELLHAANKEIVSEKDTSLGEQRYTWATVDLPLGG